MASAASDVEAAAERVKRRRRTGILVRRTLFYLAATLYFFAGIAHPVQLECSRVENARVNCTMRRKWVGVIPGERKTFTDVRRARLDERNYWSGNIPRKRYSFNLDIGPLLRSDLSVRWMDRQNGGELEQVASELNAWISRPSSTNYRRTLRIDFINGMLVLLLSIGVLALIERLIKRRAARQPIEIA